MKISTNTEIEIEIDVDDVIEVLSSELFLKQVIERWPIGAECNEDALAALEERIEKETRENETFNQ